MLATNANRLATGWLPILERLYIQVCTSTLRLRLSVVAQAAVDYFTFRHSERTIQATVQDSGNGFLSVRLPCGIERACSTGVSLPIRCLPSTRPQLAGAQQRRKGMPTWPKRACIAYAGMCHGKIQTELQPATSMIHRNLTCPYFLSTGSPAEQHPVKQTGVNASHPFWKLPYFTEEVWLYSRA